VQEIILGEKLIKSLAYELYDTIVQDIKKTREREREENQIEEQDRKSA